MNTMRRRTLDTLPFDIFDIIVLFISDEGQDEKVLPEESTPDNGTFSLLFLPNQYNNLPSTRRRRNLINLSSVNKHFRFVLI